MNLDRTERGFAISSFNDRYGKVCSIQKSSIATEDCIWLGVDTDMDGNAVDQGRMHLTQEQVQELLPLLIGFILTGELVPVADDTAVTQMMTRITELETTIRDISKLAEQAE